MKCPLCESGTLCEVHDCLCAVVKVGGEPTGSRNWNPDCPVHPWDDRLQAQADRAVELQREARKARRDRVFVVRLWVYGRSRYDDPPSDIIGPFTEAEAERIQEQLTCTNDRSLLLRTIPEWART